MKQSTRNPRSIRSRIAKNRLRHLRKVKPSRRHVRVAMMATVPSAALFGFAGMQQSRAAEPIVASTVLLDSDDRLMPGIVLPSAERPEAPPAAVEASYYGDEFAGRSTANGETFDPQLLTAAHRTLPFGSLVRVTDAATGNSVDVRINDRGPFHGNREIDLSTAAARELGMIHAGTAKVTLEVLRHA